MASEEATLSSLSVNKDVTKFEHGTNGSTSGNGRGSMVLGGGLVLFIILVVIVYVILVSTRPNWILKVDCKKDDSSSDDRKKKDDCPDVDNGRALLWAIVISIGLLFLFGIIYALVAGTRWC